ncbi:MAG TPA: WD40 repeat domain-containing protein [Parafilimonas sp.]|nr:WD40 repeat domain-containing protein [Parafilimonas sp.]
MPSYRYPGPRPFEENDINLFFGRERDKKNLLTFINVEQLLVLFSKSGLGKSSLINAAIIPELRKKDYEIIVCRFNSYVNKERDANIGFEPQSPLQKLFSEVKSKLNTSTTFLDTLFKKLEELSLWHQFKNLQISGSEKKTYFIFFDQFEELFTYPADQVKEFKEHLAELLGSSIPQHYLDQINQLENDTSATNLTDEQLGLLYAQIPVKILCTIRSDKFSLLTNLKDAIPGIVTKTYELKPFNTLEATEAILKPASLAEGTEGNFISNQFSYDNDAIKKMLNYLSDDGTEDIESFQLQVLCRYVEDMVIENKKKNNELKSITANQLGDIKNIFEAYYNNLIDGIDKDKVNNVKKLFEEGLIFEKDKLRVPLYKGQITDNYGVDEALLNKLVNTHLIRSEPDTNGKERYELSHDSLIEPILKAKEKRVAEEKEKENLEKQKEEQQKQLQAKEAERIRLQTQLQMQKLKSRNRIFIVAIIFILLIVPMLFYLLKQNEKYSVSSIQFRNDERDWFYSLDAVQQNLVLTKNFLFLKNKNLSKYNKIKYSYKSAALANQNAANNFALALKIAQDGFLQDSNKVIRRSFDSLINKPGVYFPVTKIINKELINNIGINNEKKLIIASTSGGVFWYNAVSGNTEDSATGKNYKSDYSVFSPDGNYLLYEKYYSDTTYLLNLLTKQLTFFKTQYNYQPHSIAFDIASKNQFFAHGNGDKKIGIYSLTGNLIKEYNLPLKNVDKINELSISPDGKYIAAGTNYGLVFLIDMQGKKNNLMTFDSASQLAMHSQIVNSISFSHDSKLIITGSSDSSVNVWNAGTRHIIQAIKFSTGVFKCRFSNDDNDIIIGGEGNGLITQFTKGEKIQNYQNKGITSNALNFNKDSSRFFGLDSIVTSVNFYNNNSEIIASSNHEIILLQLLKKNPETISEVLKTNSIPQLKLNEKVALKLEPLQDLLALTSRRQVFESIKMLNDSLDNLNEKEDAIKENRQIFIELSDLIPKLFDHLKDCKEDRLNKLDKLDSFDIYIYTGNSYFYKILLDEDSMNGKIANDHLEKLIAFRQAPFELDTMHYKCFEDLFTAYFLPVSYFFKNKQYDSALYWTDKIFKDNPELKNIAEIKNDITIVNQYDVSFRILNNDILGAQQSLKDWQENSYNLNYVLTKELVSIFNDPNYTFNKNKFINALSYFDLTDEDNKQNISDMDAIAYRLLDEKTTRKLSVNIINNLTAFDNYIYSLAE